MMAAMAVFCLVAGIICGQLDSSGMVIGFFSESADFILYALMFFVGISVGANRSVFAKIRQYHLKILIIPLGIIFASVVAGAFCAPLLGLEYGHSMAVSSALGWYSLSGVMITELGSADMGATAFLSSLLREILSFAAIPLIAKYLNPYTTIAPAAATSEDTTLPAILKYGGAETAVMAVFNGVLCSAAVPFLIEFFMSLGF